MSLMSRIDYSKRDHIQRPKPQPLPVAPAGSSASSMNKIQCVRVFCERDRKPGVFEVVERDASHPIFSSAPLSPVSKLIKLPLRVFQEDPLPNPLGHPERAMYQNQPITYLMIQPKHGFASMEYQDAVGTAVVARDDRKPLYEKHLEVVLMFFYHLIDLYGEGDPAVPQRKMTRSEFELFFDSYRNKRALLDPAWKHVI